MTDNAVDPDDNSQNADSDDNLNPRKRGLGRGLNALFEDEETSYETGTDSEGTGGAGTVMLDIDQIEPGPYQPRKDMKEGALDELAASISVHGVLQPLLVTRKDGTPDQYHIIAGERRWRAAQRAQLHQVPVIVRDFEPQVALEVALIENLQREDLNALEEAAGYKRLMDEYSYTQEKLAAEVGKSRSHVANMMRLLALPPVIQGYLKEGTLSAGHARALLSAKSPEALARRVIDEGLSVRETERLAAGEADKPEKDSPKSSSSSSGPKKDLDTLALEEEISAALGMKITIDMKGKHSGVLKVEYRDLDQLDEVLHRLSHYPGSRLSG